jgi:hypothetical protein
LAGNAVVAPGDFRQSHVFRHRSGDRGPLRHSARSGVDASGSEHVDASRRLVYRTGLHEPEQRRHKRRGAPNFGECAWRNGGR